VYMCAWKEQQTIAVVSVRTRKIKAGHLLFVIVELAFVGAFVPSRARCHGPEVEQGL